MSALRLERKDFDVFEIEVAGGFRFFEGRVQTDLVDCAHSVGAHKKLNPHVLLNPIVFLLVEIDVESALCATL